MCSQQLCSNCLMLSRQYEPKSLNSVFNISWHIKRSPTLRYQYVPNKVVSECTIYCKIKTLVRIPRILHDQVLGEGVLNGKSNISTVGTLMFHAWKIYLLLNILQQRGINECHLYAQVNKVIPLCRPILMWHLLAQRTDREMASGSAPLVIFFHFYLLLFDIYFIADIEAQTLESTPQITMQVT